MRNTNNAIRIIFPTLIAGLSLTAFLIKATTASARKSTKHIVISANVVESHPCIQTLISVIILVSIAIIRIPPSHEQIISHKTRLINHFYFKKVTKYKKSLNFEQKLLKKQLTICFYIICKNKIYIFIMNIHLLFFNKIANYISIFSKISLLFSLFLS